MVCCQPISMNFSLIIIKKISSTDHCNLVLWSAEYFEQEDKTGEDVNTGSRSLKPGMGLNGQTLIRPISDKHLTVVPKGNSLGSRGKHRGRGETTLTGSRGAVKKCLVVPPNSKIEKKNPAKRISCLLPAGTTNLPRFQACTTWSRASWKFQLLFLQT